MRFIESDLTGEYQVVDENRRAILGDIAPMRGGFGMWVFYAAKVPLTDLDLEAIATKVRELGLTVGAVRQAPVASQQAEGREGGS